jgi:hypothetical protein
LLEQKPAYDIHGVTSLKNQMTVEESKTR